MQNTELELEKLGTGEILAELEKLPPRFDWSFALIKNPKATYPVQYFQPVLELVGNMQSRAKPLRSFPLGDYASTSGQVFSKEMITGEKFDQDWVESNNLNDLSTVQIMVPVIPDQPHFLFEKATRLHFFVVTPYKFCVGFGFVSSTKFNRQMSHEYFQLNRHNVLNNYITVHLILFRCRLSSYSSPTDIAAKLTQAKLFGQNWNTDFTLEEIMRGILKTHLNKIEEFRR